LSEKPPHKIENEIRQKYGEDVADKFSEALKELRARGIRFIELTHTWNIDLEKMPMLVIGLEDGGQKYLVYNPSYDEVYEEDDFMGVSDYLDCWNLDSLDPNIDYFELPYSEVRELDYGNRFSVILDNEDYYLKIAGAFLGKVVAYEVPESVFNAFSISEANLAGNILRIIDEIKPVLATYTFKRVDPWRGHYEGRSAGNFVKVVEGWIGLGSSDPAVEKLSKVHKLDEDPPCTPMLFVFPRSTNICVTYFDVYVRRGDVHKFRRWFGDVDAFSFSRGINIRTLYNSRDSAWS